MLEHSFFIFALTIPFDIKDQQMDEDADISNLANTLGSHKSYQLILALSISAILVSIGLYYLQVYTNLGLICTLMFYVVLYRLCSIKSPRSELYYLFGLDGLILIKGLILPLSIW